MGFFEIFAALLAGLYAIVPSYGLAIILLTLVTRIVLLPLSIKQTRSMREMQLIQPEVKKIQAKYKGNRQKMNEEMMKLYKEHGVNPLGGCLPLLLQFPILIALFYVIRNPLSYMGYHDSAQAADVVNWVPNQVSGIMETIQNSSLAQGLLNIPLDLNRFLGLRLDCHPSEVLSGKSSLIVPDVACSAGGFVPFIPYLLLILLMGFTTYYSQRQMQAKAQTGDNPAAAQMQMMGRIMPALFMFFAFNFPTGVILYWVTTNVWTIIQQRIMLKAAPLPVTPAKKTGGDGQAKGAAKPKLSKASPGGKGSSNGGKSPSKASSRPHPSSKKKKKR